VLWKLLLNSHNLDQYVGTNVSDDHTAFIFKAFQGFIMDYLVDDEGVLF
jgi:hypothetical protein